MKARFHRFWSSRSFTRFISIVAVAVVAFAALELLFVQQALANVYCCNNTTHKCICDASLACPSTYPTNSFRQCGTVGLVVDQGTMNSTISCTGVSGTGTNSWTSTNMTREGILYCTVAGSVDQSHDGTAFCELDLSYDRPAGLQTSCTAVPNSNPVQYTTSHQAFCGQVGNGPAAQRLTVTGTLKCNSPDVSGLNSNPPPQQLVTLDTNGLPTVCGGNTGCTLNLGIAGQGNCDMFPADPALGLADDQVLKFTRTFASSSCEDPPTDLGLLHTRYCNGGSFNGAPVDCTFGTGKTQEDATVVGTADNVLVFDVDFNPPQVHNLGCTGGSQSNDFWGFKIIGNEQLNVALIDETTLKIEGVSPNTPITCLAVNNTLTCSVKMCPDVSPAVAEASFPVGNKDFVNITVTGELDSGTPIIGEQLIEVNGL